MKSATVIILFHMYFKTVLAELIVRPSDTTSALGKFARFDCSTKNVEREIQWFHYPMGAKDRSIVYGYSAFQPPYDKRFQLQQNTGQGVYNLSISPINETDAGGYECQDDGGFGEKSRAELTVFKTDLVCTSNISNNVIIGPNNCGIQPDVLQFSCSVSYLGNVDPILEWILDGDSNVITDGVTREISNRLITYKLMREVHAGMDGHYYICQTKKSSTGPQQTCRSEVIKVWHAPNDSSLVEKTTGAELHCDMEIGQFPCNFQWMRRDHNGEIVVSNEKSFTPADPGLYRCQVDCSIKGKECSMSTTLVLVTTHVEEQPSYKAPFIAALIAFIIASIVLVICLINSRRLKNTIEKKKRMINNLEKDVKDRENTIKERNELIATQENTIKERNEFIATQENTIKERNEFIATQENTIKERNALIATQENTIKEKDKVIATQKNNITKKNESTDILEDELDALKTKVQNKAPLYTYAPRR